RNKEGEQSSEQLPATSHQSFITPDPDPGRGTCLFIHPPTGGFRILTPKKMQNKPNFKTGQIALSDFSSTGY
ncbi:MAG: hypothetical protein ACYSO1_05935, partial [Planctomycetota bacterium]